MRRSPERAVVPAPRLGPASQSSARGDAFLLARERPVRRGQSISVGVGLTRLQLRSPPSRSRSSAHAGAIRGRCSSGPPSRRWQRSSRCTASRRRASSSAMNGVVAFTGGATCRSARAILALSALPAFRRRERRQTVDRSCRCVLLAVDPRARHCPGCSIAELVPERSGGRSSAPALALLGRRARLLRALETARLRTFLLTRRASRSGRRCRHRLAGCGSCRRRCCSSTWSSDGGSDTASSCSGIIIVGVRSRSTFVAGPSRSPLVGDLTGADLVTDGGGVPRLARAGAHRSASPEKDEYTEEHTRRVALLAVQVGEELELSPVRVRSRLATGALVHDIGKLSVPDSILKKPGPLTDEEFSAVKRHSDWGDRMLGDLGFGDIRPSRSLSI